MDKKSSAENTLNEQETRQDNIMMRFDRFTEQAQVQHSGL